MRPARKRQEHWVAQHRKGWPVVYFDDARAQLGLKHGENDGLAAHHAVDQAKTLLRRQERFVSNATHLSEQMRNTTLWNAGIERMLHRWEVPAPVEAHEAVYDVQT